MTNNRLISLFSHSFNFVACRRFQLPWLRCQWRGLSRRQALITALSLSWLSADALAAPPVAVPDVRTVLEDRAITVNVLTNDFDPDGDIIRVIDVTQPETGSTTLNIDDSITFTPSLGFLGETTFTYTIEDITDGPAMASADVIISTTEFDSAFSELTSNNKTVAEALDGACTALRDGEFGEGDLSAGEQQLLDRCEGLIALGLPNSDLNAVFRAIAPEETAAQFRVSSENSRQQTQAVNQRLSLLKQGVNQFSVNGMSLFDSGATGGSAGDGTSSFSRLGLFASVQVDGADRDETEKESGYEQSGQVYTFGADYAVSPQIFVGAAIGITKSDLDYSKNGGDLETDITTLIIYATYYREQISADLQVGFGSIDYDSSRRIQYIDGNGPVDALAVASTEGSQFILNGQVQYDWYRDALTLYPFLRFDYVESEIDSYGENNGQGLEIEFEDQEFSRMTLSAGIQGSYAISQEWGVLIPTFQASLLSETSVDNDDIVGRFAFDLEDDNKFNLVQDDRDSVFYQVGVGVVATLPRGLSLFAEYMQTLSYANLDVYQVQAGIRYEF